MYILFEDCISEEQLKKLGAKKIMTRSCFDRYELTITGKALRVVVIFTYHQKTCCLSGVEIVKPRKRYLKMPDGKKYLIAGNEY